MPPGPGGLSLRICNTVTAPTTMMAAASRSGGASAARRRCDGSAVFPQLIMSIDVPLAVVRASAPRPQFAMSRVSVEVHGAASA